ncbi:MAG: YitT family protein [Kyrpidia sp.]|nr:YitT family protein [Kyrpidia sp.]
MKAILSKSAGIAAGAFIFSVGLNNFLIANHLSEGGFVGLSVLGWYLFHIPVGATFLVLNVPLLWLGGRMFGREFVLKTLWGVAAVSIFSELTKGFQTPVDDKLLAALYGGVLSGIGLGIVFRFGATTGGADVIARVVKHFWGISMGKTLFAIDVAVIGMIAVLIGRQTAMYSLVALFVSSRVVDFVLEGISAARAATIISDRSEEIADRIHLELGRGTTLVPAVGGYTGIRRRMVYTVVHRDEIIRLHWIVKSVDPEAFVVVNEVHDVLGEGFTR